MPISIWNNDFLYSKQFVPVLLISGTLKDARLDNLDLHEGTAVGTNVCGLNLTNDVHTLENTTEDDVLSVEPSGLDGGDEEFYKQNLKRKRKSFAQVC